MSTKAKSSILFISSAALMLSVSGCATEGANASEEDMLDTDLAASSMGMSASEPYWTDWMDKDNPSGNGDYEIDFPDPCNGVLPGSVLVQTTSGSPYQDTGEIVHVDPIRGGWCVNGEQPDGLCDYNYRVKFYCDPGGSWTGWMDKDNSGGNGDYEIDFPNLCNGMVPMNVIAETTTGVRLEYTGEFVYLDPSRGAWCVNSKQSDGYCDYDYRVKFYCAGGGAWTSWMDKDDPSGNGDYEIGFPSVCGGASPANVNVQTTTGIPYQNTGETVYADSSPELGGWCVNERQSDGYCDYDYRVKFYCP